MMPDSSGWATAERAAVWAAFIILPQLLLCNFALRRAAGCKRILPIIGQFPAILGTPIVATLAFGPHTKEGFVVFSPKYTLLNAGITVVMGAALVPVANYFYSASYGDMVKAVAFIVFFQFFALTLALTHQFPNSKAVKFLRLKLDVAVLDAVSMESMAEVKAMDNNNKLPTV